MKTIELKLYKFEELNEKAQEKAVQNFREGQYGDPYLLEVWSWDAKDEIESLGFENPNLQYSLNSCQGDGLSFSAESFNRLEQLYLDVLGKGKERTAKLLAENTTVEIKGNTGNHYCYASTSDVDMYFDEFPANCENIDNIENVQGQVLNILATIYMEVCNKLENEGYEQIFILTGDEYIRERLIESEHDFTENGETY